jgi:hypothetical protein
MQKFQGKYKNPGFGDTDHRRYLRAYNCDKTRREIRRRIFDRNRNLQDSSAPTSSQPATTVSTITDELITKKKLQQWKDERNKKKKLEASMKKPVFKVGIVHHSYWYSPISKSVSITKTKPIKRATEKDDKQITNTKKQKSFAPINHCFKPPSGLQNIFVPMKQTPQDKYTQKLNEPTIRDSDQLNAIKTRSSLKEQTSLKKENCSEEYLLVFSPYLTPSRGKKNNSPITPSSLRSLILASKRGSLNIDDTSSRDSILRAREYETRGIDRGLRMSESARHPHP